MGRTQHRISINLISHKRRKRLHSAPKKKAPGRAKLFYPHLNSLGEWTHCGPNCGAKKCPCEKYQL